MKSWFYEIESEHEYIFSRQFFFLWIKSMETIISKNCVEKIIWWIKTYLDPYDAMWENNLWLHITGFDARTTLVGESCHYL